MSTITITVNVTGIADEHDKRAMAMLIDAENERRAASTPPSVSLPKSTAAERKASYEFILMQMQIAQHATFISQAGEKAMFSDLRPLWQAANDAQRAAALAALQ